MPMPDPGTSMHVASVNYVVVFAEVASAVMPATFSNLGGTSFVFRFDTGEAERQAQPGTWDVSWDASWFDQAAIETAIAASLDQNCAAIAQLLGVSAKLLQAAVTVRRLWTFNQNSYQVIPGVTSGAQQVTIPDVMAYPAA